MVSIAELPKYEAYKDSGVDWLGEIPVDWNVVPLRYLAQVQAGNTPSKAISSYYSEADGFPWVKPDELIEFRDIFTTKEKLTSKGLIESRKIRKGSILVCCIGTIGKIGVAGCDLSTNQQINSVTFFEKINLRFSKYLVFSSIPEHEKLANGNVVKILNADTQKSIKLPIPSAYEQSLIANFLDQKTTQVDEAIAIKEQQIVLLKERKQIIIQKAVTQGLDPDVPMKDSGVDWIGKIPAHWEVIKLKHLFKEVTSRTKTGSETLFSLRMEIGLVPHNDVSDKHIPPESLVDYKIVECGQMVMNRMRAAIGIFGLATDYGLVSPDYAVFDVASDVVPDYYLTLFKLPLMGTQFRLASKGMGTGSSGFMRLYTDEFGDIKVANPPKEEQEALVRFIAETNRATDLGVDHLQSQIEKLKEYKTTLINSAVTGKIKVTPEMAGIDDVAQDAVEA
ncbi:MAG: restriction endonuclease subunit S [Reinekea sp.]